MFYSHIYLYLPIYFPSLLLFFPSCICMILSRIIFLPSDKHPTVYLLVQTARDNFYPFSLPVNIVIFISPLLLWRYLRVWNSRFQIISVSFKDVIPLFLGFFFSAKKPTVRGVLFFDDVFLMLRLWFFFKLGIISSFIVIYQHCVYPTWVLHSLLNLRLKSSLSFGKSMNVISSNISFAPFSLSLLSRTPITYIFEILYCLTCFTLLFLVSVWIFYYFHLPIHQFSLVHNLFRQNLSLIKLWKVCIIQLASIAWTF